MSKVAVIGLVGNSAFLSVNEFHKGGETLVANDIHFEPGGKGFNQAVAAARYGAEVSFLGALGNDYVHEAESFCIKENIKSFLAVKKENTPYAAIITDKSGNTRVTVYQGARLEGADVDLFAKEISTSDVLLINNEVPEEVNVKAVEIAVKSNTRVIMNPAPSRRISPYLLEKVFMFTPNEHETKGLESLNNVIVTLGSKGCFIRGTEETVPAVSLGKAVDTTGAGDTFNGVLAAMIACGADLKEAVKKATVAAGLSVTKKYAVSSIPRKEEIDNI